jgi:uncharacterized protein YkwD
VSSRCLRLTPLICALALAAPSVAAAGTHQRKPHHKPAHSTTKPAKPAKLKTRSTATPATSSASTRSTSTLPAQTPVPAACANAQAPAASTIPTALRAAVVCLVNQQRVGRGLPQLKENPLLDTSAQLWTDTMVVTQVFSHGTNFSQRLARVGYDWSNAGENIGTGYETPDDVIAAWMASPEHCQNILNPNYADIGVGVNPSPVGTNVADAASWTQDFGLTMTAPYPSANTAPMNGCPYGA